MKYTQKRIKIEYNREYNSHRIELKQNKQNRTELEQNTIHMGQNKNRIEHRMRIEQNKVRIK